MNRNCLNIAIDFAADVGLPSDVVEHAFTHQLWQSKNRLAHEAGIVSRNRDINRNI